MSVFKFKQFEVDQSGCAMKINTDGVLIGAMATHPDAKNILDVGTGTGVIALMMAQRFPDAKVHAVEIDEQAALTAGKNFRNSTFSTRLSIYHTAIADYTTLTSFDLIVTNPPFFVNDLKNAEVRKGIARHTHENFFEELIAKASILLAPQGKIWLILPVKQADEVIRISGFYRLYLEKRFNLHSDQSKPTFRQIICLSRLKQDFEEHDFHIYESPKTHSSSYEALLKDFFLAY